MGIVTTKLRTVSEELLLQLKAEHYFEVVVGSEDVQNCKPHPEPLLLAAKKLEVNPRSCIYIGDSLHDALSARSAETEFIGVLTGTGKEEELKPFGNVFKTLSDIKKYLWD